MLKELYKKKYKNESLILCCCYIDAFGNLNYYPNSGGRNFINILIEGGGNKIFKYIHPKQLQDSMKHNRNLKNISIKLNGLFLKLLKGQTRLYTEKQFHNLAKNILNKDEIQKLDTNLWRGTYAAIAYKVIRNPCVHSLGTTSLSFSNTTYRGKAVPVLDFNLLCRALENIYIKVKKKSFNNVSWFKKYFN